MSSMPMSQPDPSQQQGADPSGGAPSQQQADPSLTALAKISQVLKRIAQGNSALAPGLEKAVAGIQEAQAAMLSAPQPQPATQNPPY
jgi:hypothetical protein